MAIYEKNFDYLAIKINYNDASFILTSSFVIFTMQTGFSLLQSGCIRRKNQVAMMLKTTFNPIITGLSFWLLAYGFTDTSDTSNEFIGVGSFLADSIEPDMGQLFASFTYRLSTMSTASNIVLGAMAERISFVAYFAYLTLITIAFAIPNYWVTSGFLHQVGTVDIAGCSFIHLSGGTAGLMATLLLKPRSGRFDYPLESFELCDPTNALLGTYMLWWGMVGYHMSSTFGLSNSRWIYCTRSAIITILASSVGGVTSILFSYLFHDRQINIKLFVCGLFSGMVAVSGGCTLFNPWQALLVGFVGSLCALVAVPTLKHYRIDDPINTIAIHMGGSIWGMIAVGLLADSDPLFNTNGSGLFQSGSFHLLGAQMAAIISIMAWSGLLSYLCLKVVAKFIPLRVDYETEETGLDVTLNKINTDFEWDKILAPNPDPTKKASSSRRKTQRKLAKVINAIIAVNRLIAGSSKFGNQLKAYNTKVLAQSWSSVHNANSSARVRPMYTEPHP